MRIIGIDIGGTNTDIGILDEKGQILQQTAIPTEVEKGPESCMDRIAAAISEVVAQSGIAKNDVAGIGVGCAGPLDTLAGCMVHSPNFPKNWIGFSITDSLSNHLGLPVKIDNDANAAALAELWAGKAQGIDDFLLLTLGTGIGGGIVANGKVVRGSAGLGAELGHVGVYPGGETCGCGKKGCMEAYASATGMIKMAKRLLKSSGYQKGSSQLEKESENKIDAKLIFDLARSGDPLAIQILEKAGEALGMGIGTLLNIFNPKKVILAGRMSLSFDLLAPYVNEVCKKHAFESIIKGVSIEATSLGTNAGLVGAAAVLAYKQGIIRKTPLIYPAPQPYTIAAIHVGAAGMRIAIVNINEDCRSYNIISPKHIPGIQPNEEAILNKIKEGFEYVLTKSEKKLSDLKGFSVMSPGPIDRKNKQILNTPNVKWSYVYIKDKLYNMINELQGMGIPLYLERDAIAITFAEQYFGYGRDLKNFATIYIGTGIGAGFFFNGELFHGVQDHAGEFGHGIIEWHSKEVCHCENKGCLECFASGRSLIAYCKDELKDWGETSILSANVNDLHYNHIIDAANKGDELAVNAFQKMGKALGIGLSNLINYLDLEKVIISGPLSRGSRHYLDLVRGIAAQNIMITEGPEKWCQNNIVATQFGDEDIEIAGAVAAFIDQHSK